MIKHVITSSIKVRTFILLIYSEYFIDDLTLVNEKALDLKEFNIVLQAIFQINKVLKKYFI